MDTNSRLPEENNDETIVQVVARQLRSGAYAGEVDDAAVIYLGAVLRLLIKQILQGAAEHAKKGRHGTQEGYRITPRHIQLAVRENKEIQDLLVHASLPEQSLPALQLRRLPTLPQPTSSVSETSCGSDTV